MISSVVSRLVILVFGNLYPAYASYKAVRTKNVKEYVKWMMYWIVFALFTCAETFTDVFFSFWFPFYYEIKTILVVWLLSPATKGSSILYRRFVHPALIRREAEIDDALARATEQGYTAVLHLGTKGVNYATTVLMQTAIKLKENVASEPSTSRPQTSSSGVFSSDRPAPASSSATAAREDQLDGFEIENPMASSSYDDLAPSESVPSVDEDSTDFELDPGTNNQLIIPYDNEDTYTFPADELLPRKKKSKIAGKNTKWMRSSARDKVHVFTYSDDDDID